MKDRVISLLTDFGSDSWYPGVMKGVILGINPDARLVDLSNDIAKQDIREAGFVVGAAYRFFPVGTVFVCVVDPGVGSDRKNIILEASGRFFVAPDNGVLTGVYEKADVGSIHSVETDRYVSETRGITFLGRDLFAPLAAELSLGSKPSDIGKPVESLARAPALKPAVDEGGMITGHAAHIDTFGNIITDIDIPCLEEVFGSPVPWDRLCVEAEGRMAGMINNYYSEGKEGELMALINSWGNLEIAVYRGNAAKHLENPERESMRITVSSLSLRSGARISCQ